MRCCSSVARGKVVTRSTVRVQAVVGALPAHEGHQHPIPPESEGGVGRLQIIGSQTARPFPSTIEANRWRFYADPIFSLLKGGEDVGT